MRPFGCHVGDVCFVHWPVDPGVLDTRLPHALSPATRRGAGWVSLLAMRTRPLAGPVGLPGEFSQVTLRTYVRVGDEDAEGDKGDEGDGGDGGDASEDAEATDDGEEAVYFLRVDTDSRLVALGARTVFDVPFQHVDAGVSVGPERVQVETHTPGGSPLFDATFARNDDAGPVTDGSLVAWLTDRDTYALGDGRTGRVEHDTWAVAETDVTVRLDALLGSEGLAAAIGDPLVRYSPGADFVLTEWPS